MTIYITSDGNEIVITDDTQMKVCGFVDDLVDGSIKGELLAMVQKACNLADRTAGEARKTLDKMNADVEEFLFGDDE